MWRYSNTYLAHHGIKGQKWGVRRYQNEDGSLTEAGRRRYGVEEAKKELEDAKTKNRQLKKEYSRVNKKTYLTSEDKKILKEYEKSKYKIERNKALLSNEKAYAKSVLKNKSNRQLKLEEQYKKNGMSEKDAEIQAYKRIRTEKTLMAVGGIAAASLAAYSVYKHYDNKTDKILKAGTSLGRITTDTTEQLKGSDVGVRDAFYAFTNKFDASAYKGLYGNQLKTQNNFLGARPDIFEKTINLSKDVKIASRDNAAKSFKDLMKNNKEFRKNVEDSFDNFYIMSGKAMGARALAGKKVKKGIYDKQVYEAFNIGLANHMDSSMEKASKTFYNDLKSKGYGAIKDINDSKYSGYKTKNPLIFFGAQNSIGEIKDRKINDNEVGNNFAVQAGRLLLTPTLGATVAGTAASKAINKQSVNDSILVENYRKEHPETKKSYTEIVKMLKKKK